jgi:CysZ protein
MFQSIAKAFSDVLDMRMIKVLITCFILSFIVLGLMIYGSMWAVAHTTLFSNPFYETMIDWAGRGLAVIVAWFLFPAVAGIITSFRLESVIEVVEEINYPDVPKPRSQPMWEIIVEAIKLTVLMVVFNLIAMPIYIPLWFLGLGMILYYALNGYLLGREYFDMVAIRRLEPKALEKFRREHRGTMLKAGVVLALGFTIPFLNMIMPVIGVSFMVHVFESLQIKTKKA